MHPIREAFLDRARFEAGGSDAPHEVRPMPRSSEFEDVLMASGAGGTIALQHGSVPSKDVAWWSGTLGGFGSLADATPAVHSVRSVKSRWELEQMEAAAVIQHRMFEAIEAEGGEGSTELELASVAESISRSEGFEGGSSSEGGRWIVTELWSSQGGPEASRPTSIPRSEEQDRTRSLAWGPDSGGSDRMNPCSSTSSIFIEGTSSMRRGCSVQAHLTVCGPSASRTCSPSKMRWSNRLVAEIPAPPHG